MKAKFGLVITEGRGKLGGHVVSKNRNGQYVRTKVTPVNPQTASQNGVRNVFTGFSQGWRSLTQTQRDAWNAAVSDFARTNIFGDLVNPSGFNLYQRINNNLSIIGEDAITLPPLPSEVGVIIIEDMDVTITTPSVSIDLTGEVPANTAVKVYATAPQSAGKSFVKSEYRLISVLAAGSGVTANLTTPYVTKFGSVGAVGQKIFVKLVAVNTTTGQEGTPSSISAISVAGS